MTWVVTLDHEDAGEPSLFGPFRSFEKARGIADQINERYLTEERREREGYAHASVDLIYTQKTPRAIFNAWVGGDE